MLKSVVVRVPRALFNSKVVKRTVEVVARFPRSDGVMAVAVAKAVRGQIQDQDRIRVSARVEEADWAKVKVLAQSSYLSIDDLVTLVAQVLDSKKFKPEEWESEWSALTVDLKNV